MLIIRNLLRSLPALTLFAAATAHAQITSTPVTTNNGTPPSANTPSTLPSAPIMTPAAPMPNAPATLPGYTLPATEGAAPTETPNNQAPNNQAVTQTPGNQPGVVPRISQLPNGLGAENAAAIPANAPTLTIAQAEAIALAHNPSIDIARLTALAQGQVTRETRSAYFPTIGGAASAVQAEDGTRITAGALNNPALYSRAAFGATLNQLLTDFGRTRNLVATANLRTDAATSTLAATHDDIIFAVDAAFYRALGAQTLIDVARQTVQTRRATANQIAALTNARLRSTLDLSFANADLARAQLQVLDARNASIEAQATLSALLGDERSTVYRLIDETPAAPVLPPIDAQPLVAQAFQSRPDLRALAQTAQAQHDFARAEHDLLLPSLSALGAVGTSPERSSAITREGYGAVGVNLTVPIFNGFLFNARAAEARLRASAADSQVRQLRDDIARDVTTTVLQAQSNFSRIAVSEQLAQQANAALQLAQTRYNLGLSSIVELSQAQLLQTEAAIQLTNAKYAYQGSLSAIKYQTGQ